MATKRFMILPLLGVVLACSTALGDDSKALLEGVDAQRLKPSSSQVSASPGAGGLEVRIEAGDDGYPGLAILPPGGQPWDLSGFGHVEARVVNTGEKAFTLNLRVDNAGDWKKNPWNNESRKLKPGEATVIKVIFGHSYGYKPSFKLNPGAVTQLLLFTGKTKAPRSFRIESITAGGSAGEKPPVKPGDVRIKPTEGVLLGPGVDPQKDLKLQGKDATTIEAGGNGAVRVRFDRGGDDAAVVRPHIGRWDLRDSLLVHVKLKNVGDAPVKPRIRIETNGGPSDWASSEEPLAPGQTQTLTASFIAETPWRGPQEVKGKHIAGEHGTGARNTSDAVSGISIAAAKADAPRMVEVESITASMPVADTPDWLGKRPPVEGDWVLTLEDNFDSGRIDLDRWNIYTENYWDKRSHFSKDNVILEDGMVKLRYERKRGHENDDPSRKETNYATGFLDGYGKWTQTYGYFEARMKLPTAPGLWPAFWLMPDRGADKGPQWVRASTEKGGMEFDILEHLTRWGPHRYNIAFHWNGYGKEHQSTGATTIYAPPDEDGFITAGLLWLPGRAVVYANGREVARWEHERISNVPSYPIFTLVSGGWDNSPIDDAQLPDDLVIDYIRCWQLRERMTPQARD